jgi:flavin-dependent dehydrogenase
VPSPRNTYLCFKTHLPAPNLPPNTIAIGGAPGLYVGLVHSSHQASLAFVVRRDRLDRLGSSPNDQFAALLHENQGFQNLLADVPPPDRWLSSGPLSPGVRQLHHDGRFFLGNAAGEVHALVGEGITLALGSATLFANAVQRFGPTPAAGHAYDHAWRRLFFPRYTAAQLFANLLMRPRASALAARCLSPFPPLLHAAIRWAGK